MQQIEVDPAIAGSAVYVDQLAVIDAKLAGEPEGGDEGCGGHVDVVKGAALDRV